LLEDYLAGNTILTDEELTLADLNGDGAISAIDGELLENYINGVLDSLPANPIKIVYDFEWEPTVDQARDEDYVIAFYSETYDAEGNVLGTVETHRRIKMIQPEETGYGTEPPEPQIEFVFDSTQNPDGSVMIKFRAETLDDQSRYPSDDPRRIAQWEWDFGDESSYGKSQVVAIDHTYAKSGTYTVTLWATNYGGESADVERNVIVKVLLPDEILSVEIEPPFASGVIVGIGNLARFTFTADTKHAFNLPIQAYSWELKKINARWGETITTDSNSVRCEFGSGSSYILIVTVEDEYGNSATDSADISIYDQTGYGQGYWIWEN